MLIAEPAEPVEIVVFVCPGAAGPGLSHAARLWMDTPIAGLLTASFDYPGVSQPGDGDALRRMLGTARAALACVRTRAPDAPLILVGTSLGAAPALVLTHGGFRNALHDWIHEIVPGLVPLRHF